MSALASTKNSFFLLCSSLGNLRCALAVRSGMHSQSKLVTNPMVYDSFDCIERSVVFCLLFLDFFFLFVSLAHKVHTSSTHTQTHTHRARTLHTSPIAGQRRKCMIDDWLFSEFLTRAKQKVFTWFPVCCCCFCCHHHWCSSAFSIWFQCIHTFYITWNNALKENQKKRRREREQERTKYIIGIVLLLGIVCWAVQQLTS